MIVLLSSIACFCSLGGYLIYYHDLKKAKVKANLFSWIIWSFSMLLETLTYSKVSGDFYKYIFFGLSTAAGIAITLKIWQRGKFKKPNITEKISLTLCSVALVSWAVFQSAWIAHVILLVSIPITFLPVFRDTTNNFKNENSIAWYIWAASDFVFLIVVVGRLQSFVELPYIIIEFLCHLTVVAIIISGKLKNRNSNEVAFTLKLNKLGKAVYATRNIGKGTVIMNYSGELMHVNEVRRKSGDKKNYFLQVSDQLFLGPSGGLNDYINHSCNPNAALVYEGTNVYIKAIKTIHTNTEITYDYSTSSAFFNWKMKCDCSEKNCRGIISGFEYLDKKIQDKYLALNIVAPFITTNNKYVSSGTGEHFNLVPGDIWRKLLTKESTAMI